MAPQGTHPARPGEHGSPDPLREERTEAIPSRSGNTSGQRLAAPASDGVRKNTARGGKGRRSVRKDGPRRPSARLNTTAMATSSRQKTRDPTSAAPSPDGASPTIRRRASPSLSGPRAHRSGHGTERVRTGRMQRHTVCSCGGEGGAGRRSSRAGPQGPAEGNLEGEQGPGRTGRRAPSTVRDGTDLLAEQGLEGQLAVDTSANAHLETDAP